MGCNPDRGHLALEHRLKDHHASEVRGQRSLTESHRGQTSTASCCSNQSGNSCPPRPAGASHVHVYTYRNLDVNPWTQPNRHQNSHSHFHINTNRDCYPHLHGDNYTNPHTHQHTDPSPGLSRQRQFTRLADETMAERTGDRSLARETEFDHFIRIRNRQWSGMGGSDGRGGSGRLDTTSLSSSGHSDIYPHQPGNSHTVPKRHCYSLKVF